MKKVKNCLEVAGFIASLIISVTVSGLAWIACWGICIACALDLIGTNTDYLRYE